VLHHHSSIETLQWVCVDPIAFLLLSTVTYNIDIFNIRFTKTDLLLPLSNSIPDPFKKAMTKTTPAVKTYYFTAYRFLALSVELLLRDVV
jgi:hypothetical protein